MPKKAKNSEQCALCAYLRKVKSGAHKELKQHLMLHHPAPSEQREAAP